jgi:predicted nucleic acid-binding protein
MKERLYIETSVVSYLCSRPSTDMIVAAHQKLTHRWWRERASRFEMLISELVYQEAAAGDAEAAGARLEAVAACRILTITEAAVSLAERLVANGPIPREHAADALHIAIAAVNGMDYLLTWNCKHLANAMHRSRIESLVDKAGYICPVICTPEELMED